VVESALRSSPSAEDAQFAKLVIQRFAIFRESARIVPEIAEAIGKFTIVCPIEIGE
jgi:hypothetical protein